MAVSQAQQGRSRAENECQRGGPRRQPRCLGQWGHICRSPAPSQKPWPPAEVRIETEYWRNGACKIRRLQMVRVAPGNRHVQGDPNLFLHSFYTCCPLHASPLHCSVMSRPCLTVLQYMDMLSSLAICWCRPAAEHGGTTLADGTGVDAAAAAQRAARLGNCPAGQRGQRVILLPAPHRLAPRLRPGRCVRIVCLSCRLHSRAAHVVL